MWIKVSNTLLHRWVKKHIFRIFEMLPARLILDGFGLAFTLIIDYLLLIISPPKDQWKVLCGT